MKIVFCVLLGLLTGVLGCCAIPLSCFIKEIEDGLACNMCKEKDTCFAMKKMFCNSNWVTEFMLISFFAVKRKCIHAKYQHLSKGIFYILLNVLLILVLYMTGAEKNLFCLYSVAVAALLSLSVVDWKTQYIPLECNLIIGVCGIIRLVMDLDDWKDYIIGLIAVSGFLFLVNWIATPILKNKYQGVYEVDRVIGDGDMKLMAVTGLLLGWKLNFLALAIGCVLGSVIHLVLMRIKGSERQFALGPYLSLGVYITMICGEQLIGWYLDVLGVIPY